MNIPLELKWATFVTLCPTDQSTVPAPGSFRALSWWSSCPRSCSASLCWSPARWPCASSWTVRCPLTPASLPTAWPPGSATEGKCAGLGAQWDAQRSVQVYLPAARGILQCSSQWSECAVVYVSSLWATFWQAACQAIVLKSAKERQDLSPAIFASLLAELLSAALAVLCNKAGWFHGSGVKAWLWCRIPMQHLAASFISRRYLGLHTCHTGTLKWQSLGRHLGT